MKLTDFKIGEHFKCNDAVYRCTDIGTRVVVAILINDIIRVVNSGSLKLMSHNEAKANGWFNGPPYAIEETVFDEYDQEACQRGYTYEKEVTEHDMGITTSPVHD